MKVINYIIVFFLILNTSNAQEINDYDSLEIEVNLSSILNLNYKEVDYKLDYVTANLTLFPRNNEFQISSYKTTSNPEAEISFDDNSVLYTWRKINSKQLDYKLNSKIKTKTNFKEIKEKIKFPLDKINGLESYTEESETATSRDPEIMKIASELAEGEDDLYVVTHKIGNWVKKNINYSLDTLTADISQNSSWVLKNKEGVCDEITSLYTAMLRSINIPTRFVAGQAYTNIIDKFGSHAWAEVYFQGYGWIPFDITYGQFGYIDASHIKMKDDIEIKEPSVNYAWRSYGVDVSSNKLDIISNIISKEGLYNKNLNINLKLLEKEVGPGSYVPLEVEIENLNDYYLPLTIDITKAPEEIPDREKNILLKPNEIKKVFFIIKIPNKLDQGFIYTSKIEITDSFNHIFSAEIKFAKEYNVNSLEEAENKISQLEREEEKVYSRNINIECNKDKSFYYGYENVFIDCLVKNLGNTNLQDLDVCYLNECNKIDLNINEAKDFNINLKAQDIKKELEINIKNEYVNKNLFLDLNILKNPNLVIKNLNYPKKVSYKEDYKIDFDLSSESEAKNVIIKLGKDELFNLKLFKGQNEFNINFKGKNFYDKELNLSVNYQDINNKTYSFEQPINLVVEGVPFYIQYYWIFIILLILIIISMILRNKLRH